MASKKNKTKEQIFAYIKTFMLKHQYPPTIREIADGVGLNSPATVKVYLDTLIKDGTIKCGGGARMITIPGIEYREI